MPSARQKVDGLEEAIRILRGLWSSNHFTFKGPLYHTVEANVEPKPDHSIPIWLGTYGPRALELTGRLADGWIPTLEVAPPEHVGVMRQRVLDSAKRAGRDPNDVLCVYNVGVRVGEAAHDQPGVVTGSPARVVDRLLEFTRIGFQAFNFLVEGPEPEEQAERISREVIPIIRAA